MPELHDRIAAVPLSADQRAVCLGLRSHDVLNDVQRVARRYLWNGIQVIVIGPHDKIVADLRPLGAVHELDHHGDPIR